MKVVGFALPERQQTGDLEEIGTLASQLEKDDVIHMGATGVTVVGKNGNYHARFSKGVLKGVKSGTINSANIGNLIVYGSTYQNEEGEEQKRLILGVPQGVFSTSVSAKEIKEAAAKNPLAAQKFDLADINMQELVA